LSQILTSDLGQTPIERHAMPFSGLAVFTSVLVAPAVCGGDGHIGHLVAAGKSAHFRVTAQIADDDDFVDGCHRDTFSKSGPSAEEWSRTNEVRILPQA